MPPPRVLMVTGAFFPELSGGGLQCKMIVDALGRDVRFLVLTTSTNRALPLADDVDGTPVFRVPIDVARAGSTLAAGVRIARLMFALRDRFDIVHLHGFSRKSIVVVLMARLLRKKIVLTIHTAGLDEYPAARGLGALAAWCYARADLFTAVSPRLAENHRASGLASELWIVSNAVDSTRFRPAAPSERAALRARLGLSPNLTWILFVGFFSRDKAPDVLFDAWLSLQTAVPQLGLLFVGATRSPYFEVDDELAGSMRVRAGRADVADRVRFAPPEPAVEDYFRAADIFVMPSLREGFGMVVIEAMACELPVVATRLAGVTDTVVNDGDNGLLVPPGDAGAIARAIERIVADPAWARRLGANARASVVGRFGVAAAAARWRQAYDHVANAA
jgi:glycosyltransferase involved in cell wall biosynthesis